MTIVYRIENFPEKTKDTLRSIFLRNQGFQNSPLNSAASFLIIYHHLDFHKAVALAENFRDTDPELVAIRELTR